MSVHKRTVVLTPKAQADLESIGGFSHRNWGEARSDAYVDQIAAALAALAEFPNLGRVQNDVNLGLRSLHVGQHVAFYQVKAHTVTVMRILHERMDASDHFDP